MYGNVCISSSSSSCGLGIFCILLYDFCSYWPYWFHIDCNFNHIPAEKCFGTKPNLNKKKLLRTESWEKLTLCLLIGLFVLLCDWDCCGCDIIYTLYKYVAFYRPRARCCCVCCFLFSGFLFFFSLFLLLCGKCGMVEINKTNVRNIRFNLILRLPFVLLGVLVCYVFVWCYSFADFSNFYMDRIAVLDISNGWRLLFPLRRPNQIHGDGIIFYLLFDKFND